MLAKTKKTVLKLFGPLLLLALAATLAQGFAGCMAVHRQDPLDRLQRLEGWVPYWNNDASLVRSAARAGFTDLLFFHGTVDADGKVKIEKPDRLENGRTEARGLGLRTWFTVTNHGQSLDGALGSNSWVRHAESLLTAFRQSGCDHLDLDYEGLTPAQTQRLPDLARWLNVKLPDGAALSLTLQPVDGVYRPEQKAMVRTLLALPRVMTIRFMMYDYAWRGSLPGALCPLPDFLRLLDAWGDQAGKLTICLPLHGYDWPRPMDTRLPRADTLLLAHVSQIPGKRVWMRQDAELAIQYEKNGVPRMVAAPSFRAIQVRVQAALGYGVPAVSFWHLGAAPLSSVASACRRDGQLDEPPPDYAASGWHDWVVPYKRRVCRVVTGRGETLSDLGKRYGIAPEKMNRFNEGVTGDTRGKTLYIPREP